MEESMLNNGQAGVRICLLQPLLEQVFCFRNQITESLKEIAKVFGTLAEERSHCHVEFTNWLR